MHAALCADACAFDYLYSQICDLLLALLLRESLCHFYVGCVPYGEVWAVMSTCRA